MVVDHKLPFGKFKDRDLPDVPTSYLTWLAGNVKLSAGLFGAVVAELARRGIAAPAPPAPKPTPPCSRCGSTDAPRLSWHEFRDGRKAIRRTCRGCHAWQGHAPLTRENIALADRNANPAPILDALTLAEDEGVELVSDGRSVSFAGDGWRRASDRLKDAVRQQSHLLAGLLLRGRTT